jgi:hypothetical protein
VYEDGVKQDVVSLTMIHGGREYNVLSPPTPRRDGLILPAIRPRSDTAGRIFVVIIDDFHLEAALTPKTRQILARCCATSFTTATCSASSRRDTRRSPSN